MKLRPCPTSHFISVIEDGMVKKVHNMDSNGIPFVRFKNLKEIYKAADAMVQDGYDGINSKNISAGNEHSNLPFADRKTKSRNGYVFEEDQPESPSTEDNFDELTLSQLMKKSKRKKRKAPESVLTPKTEYDDSDLSEPLCKFRVKVLKTSPKKMPVHESFSPTVNVKVEALEVDYFKCGENTGDVSLVCNGQETFIASESGVIFVNHELKSKKSSSFTDEKICCNDEASFGDLDDSKNMMLDNEENMSNVNQPFFTVSSLENNSPVEDSTTSTSDCFQGQPYFQMTLRKVNLIPGVQDSDSTTDDDDVVSMDTDIPIPKEKQHLISMNADVDLNSMNSDNNSCVSEKIPIIQDQPSFVPANTNDDSEVKFFNHDYQTGITKDASAIRNSNCIEPRHPERLPSTRKAISPTSQEKLCLAMKSTELLDDMDRYKCKEKLSFEEHSENKLSSASSDVEFNEPNVHPQDASENKAVISLKNLLKKPKNYKKGCPPEKCLPPKGCLDGPRLCRSLPCLSTGCTTVQGCSESAIAFSQRQMHDIESLASKLMSELNSMKVIVEEKLLFEAYRSSTSLKNEADEVKSAIKNATKTEEAAKKWLSMMARDCNRFCKIMKQNQDNTTSASDSGDPAITIEEKPVQRERKKISFADEAGGMLCDIKVYEIDETSLELKQKQESSLA